MNPCQQNKQMEGPSGLSTKERDDAYQGVVHVEGKWRIIICKDHIQWIIQRAKKAGTERRWHGVSYVTSKTGLVALWAEKTGACADDLAQLPDTIRGDAK